MLKNGRERPFFIYTMQIMPFISKYCVCKCVCVFYPLLFSDVRARFFCRLLFTTNKETNCRIYLKLFFGKSALLNNNFFFSIEAAHFGFCAFVYISPLSCFFFSRRRLFHRVNLCHRVKRRVCVPRTHFFFIAFYVYIYQGTSLVSLPLLLLRKPMYA